MTTERPPGVASAKTLARSGLASRPLARKAGPRPCNLPSMKKSNISDTNHVEVVPSGTTGWAKTPKPSPTDDHTPPITNTWTAPPRVVADKPLLAKKSAAAVPAEPTKIRDSKAAAGKVVVSDSCASQPPAIENPFGVDINVTSWAREVSPPPPAKRAWSDASPMDFSKPVVFEQTPVVPTAARNAGPLPDNAWRPAVIRKPTVSSILKKPDSEKKSDPVPVIPQNDAAQVEAPPSKENTQPPVIVDETVQTLTMKQKAMEAMKRREEDERRREEEKKARIAEKLAALERKSAPTAKPGTSSGPISVMQRPKASNDVQAEPASTKDSELTRSNTADVSTSKPTVAGSATSEQPTVAPIDSKKSPTIAVSNQTEHKAIATTCDAPESSADNQQHPPAVKHERPSDSHDRTEDHKPSRSGRHPRRHPHRRHQEVPGSRSSSNVWHRRSDSRGLEHDDGQRLLEKDSHEGEKTEPASGRESPSDNLADRDLPRRDDKSKPAHKVMNRSQPKQSAPSQPSAESAPVQPATDHTATSSRSKSKPVYNHRKWRAKEPASPPSPPPPVPAVQQQKSDAVEEKKPAPISHPHHVPRQWKSRPSDHNPSRQFDNPPSSSENPKNTHRRKRFGPVFENAPVVGSQAGSLMWSAAAPVVATAPTLPPPRAWSTPKSNSHNAELLNQQQSRAKGSPSAALAKRALTETLASRSC